MTPYGKTAQHAISAMSRLAEVYDPARKARLGSADIADTRGLPRPVIAKVLTVLSQAGFVEGSPGPGGGYCLARPPEQIRLYDVASLFERMDENLSCPFGPDWCGKGPHCPLHHQLKAVLDQVTDFLKKNTFASFVGWEPEKGGPPGCQKAPTPEGRIPLDLSAARPVSTKPPV